MSDWEHDFIAAQRVARLATVDEHGQPHVVPIVYAFDGSRLYTPLDSKPKQVDVYDLQRVRNIRANAHVGVIIDVYSNDWEQLAWVQIRGRAELLTPNGSRWEHGVRLLHQKYIQYRRMPLTESPLIVIEFDRVVSWRATDTE